MFIKAYCNKNKAVRKLSYFEFLATMFHVHLLYDIVERILTGNADLTDSEMLSSPQKTKDYHTNVWGMKNMFQSLFL